MNNRSQSLLVFLVATVVGALTAVFKLGSLAIISSVMTVSCAQRVENASSFANRDILPANVKPTHYDLVIEPDMTTFTFTGEVTISLDIIEETKNIQLNGKDLEVDEAFVVVGDKKFLLAASIDHDREVISLDCAETLYPGTGKHVLTIKFRGIVNDKMAGFYRSSYKDKFTGEQKYLGATQFEATDARQAFPCWDEPAVKSTFKISLVVPEGVTALSNMDEVETTKRGDKVVHSFRNSPIMSTYLVAWVIGNLEFIETKNEHGVLCRVYSTKGDIEQGRFALDVASKTLDFFSEYFAIPYPLPKMDMVAIPDFSAGAMENWGLVTYRTAYLLHDEENSSLKAKQQIAYVVGHELAHQWFGNLVTMEWWTDLWLNEGFATWVGWLASDKLFPQWDIWTEFVVDDSQAGLRLDGLRSSHPIEVPVKNPKEIGQIFDSISYSKGASVIRMLVAYLGEDDFRKGLQSYLQEFKYRNARTQDLWNSLSKASGKSVNDIMNAWTHMVGYPVVDIQSCACHGSKLRVEMTQSRFLSSGDVTPDEDRTVWSIPLKIGTDQERLVANAEAQGLLSTKASSVELPGDISFFKLNIDQTGFYRVNYPPEWLEKLGVAVSQNQLSASDRIGIVSDAFAMASSNKVSLASILEMLKYFNKEADYLVWGEISTQLGELLSVWWEEREDLALLKSFIGDLYAQQVKTLGFDFGPEDSDKVKLLRPLVISMAAKCGNHEVIEEVRKRFASGSIHPNLRGTVYNVIVREDGEDGFNKVFEIYQKSSLIDQKLAALGALGASKDEAIVQRALELTKDEKIVRPQDVIYITRTAGQNAFGRRLTWDFFTKNYDFFFGRYGQGGGISLFGRLVSTSSDNFTSESDAQMVEKFYESKQTTSYDRSLQQSLERIRLRAKLLSNHRKAVSDFLHQAVKKLANIVA